MARPRRSALPITPRNLSATLFSSNCPSRALRLPLERHLARSSRSRLCPIFMPRLRVLSEVNGELATAPEKINKDAHGSWMIKLTLKDPSELNGLLSAADYEKFVAEEGGQ